MKQALDTMSQWYKKGWIDPEFIAKPTGKAMASFISGSSIATYGAWPYAYVYMTATAANNPDARFDVGTLKGPEGKSGGVMPNSLNTWYAISAKCENPEAILYMLNEMLDSGYRDDAELQSKFTFKYHDDPLQAPTNPEVLKSAMDLPKLTMNYKMPAPGLGSWSYLNNYFLKFYGIRYNQMPGEWIKYHLRIAEEIQKPAPNLIFLLSYQVYTGSIPSVGEVHFKNVANMAELKKAGNYITNRFIGRAPETQLAQGAYLSKLEQEKFARIIMGEDTVASFDDFVSQWKSSGGDKITSEVNAWYASVKK
jgi:putative aldouronate transport system substrate-binding protein